MINKEIMSFFLNDEDVVRIELGCLLEDVGRCCVEPIRLHSDKKQILLSDSLVYCDIKDLIEKLEKSLNNKLVLHKSITDDIGYLYNEYYQDESNFFLAKVDGEVTWVGYRYEVWQAYEDEKRFITWIYNDAVDSIIFEITPFYPYFFCEPEEEPHYVP